MAWTILFLAGLLEIGWAIGLKYTDGFTKLWPSVLTLASMIGSIVLLGPCAEMAAGRNGLRGLDRDRHRRRGDPRHLPVQRACDARSALACIGLIVAGIAGLKAVT